MEAKGTGVAALNDFVKKKFGTEGFENWLRTLSLEAREIHKISIMASKWYPVGPSIIEPTVQVCNLFFNGNLQSAREIGRYSADEVHKGPYKIMFKIGTPRFTINRLPLLVSLYYRPAEFVIVADEPLRTVARLVSFDEHHPVIDERLAGWGERALELLGAHEPRMEVVSSLSNGDPYSEFEVTWKE